MNAYLNLKNVKIMGFALLFFVMGAFTINMIQTDKNVSKSNVIFANPQSYSGGFSKNFEDVAAQYLPLVVSVMSEKVVKQPGFSGNPWPFF
jgi:hypothetical protein